MDKNGLISIEFFGAQRIAARTNSINMPITEKTIAGDVLEYVRHKYPALSLDEQMVLITVNHVVVPRDTPLRPNDHVCFVPGIGGG